MLQAIGKVPGFGWVGDLGDKLVSAGQKAQNLDLRMLSVSTVGRVSANQWAVVGERGAELVQFGATGRVVSHQDSENMVAGRDGGGEATATVKFVLDGRTLQTALLRLKRVNGGVGLGIN